MHRANPAPICFAHVVCPWRTYVAFVLCRLPHTARWSYRAYVLLCFVSFMIVFARTLACNLVWNPPTTQGPLGDVPNTMCPCFRLKLEAVQPECIRVSGRMHIVLLERSNASHPGHGSKWHECTHTPSTQLGHTTHTIRQLFRHELVCAHGYCHAQCLNC